MHHILCTFSPIAKQLIFSATSYTIKEKMTPLIRWWSEREGDDALMLHVSQKIEKLWGFFLETFHENLSMWVLPFSLIAHPIWTIFHKRTNACNMRAVFITLILFVQWFKLLFFFKYLDSIFRRICFHVKFDFIYVLKS